MNIVLSGQFEAAELHAWLRSLRAALPEARWLDPEQARAQADAVQVAVVANPAAGSLRGMPRLRLIQSLWAGVDRLLADPALPEGVPIARMVDPAMSAAMAETALWATLSLHRGFFDNIHAQRCARWQQQPQCRADAVQVLVLGLGWMGRAAARRIAQQGYRVHGYSLRAHDGRSEPELELERAGIERHNGADALAALLPRCHIVINLLPLTPATRGLLDARLFARMPRGGSIVNLARGAHVVDADLLAALDSGQLQRAVLDVFHTEPLPADHAFWAHERVTVLPHVAAQTDPTSASQVVARNIRALFAGQPLAHLVRRERGY